MTVESRFSIKNAEATRTGIQRLRGDVVADAETDSGAGADSAERVDPEGGAEADADGGVDSTIAGVLDGDCTGLGRQETGGLEFLNQQASDFDDAVS
jgi:hypothetical protein